MLGSNTLRNAGNKLAKNMGGLGNVEESSSRLADNVERGRYITVMRECRDRMLKYKLIEAASFYADKVVSLSGK